MGDAVLEILLREKGLLTDDSVAVQTLDYFVACLDERLFPAAVEITAKLRQKGASTNLSYKTNALKKQMKAADATNAAMCVIVGQEFTDSKEFVVKDMKTGEQSQIDEATLLKDAQKRGAEATR